MKNVAILIDFWYNDSGSHSTNDEAWIIKDVINRINKTKEIDTVAISSGEICLEELQNDPICLYTQSKFPKNWRKKTSRIIRESRRTKRYLKTHPQLLNKNNFRQDLEIYSLHYPFEFPIHHMDSVYMFGSAYDICVKYRPIGYKFWDRQTECKVYFLDRSCKFSNSTFVDFKKAGTKFRNIGKEKWEYSYEVIK